LKILLLFVAKTRDSYIREGMNDYLKRLGHYAAVDVHEVPAVRAKGDAKSIMRAEWEALEKQLQPGDVLVLLDERGDRFTSLKFAEFLEKRMNAGPKRLVFAVGGAFGFSPEAYQRAQHLVRLSDMTFSHQMIRLFLTEQIYRAWTILKNESYHHE
jgi:23S rRNA (pseudouridine1915-N3)-methyltransferase